MQNHQAVHEELQLQDAWRDTHKQRVFFIYSWRYQNTTELQLQHSTVKSR